MSPPTEALHGPAAAAHTLGAMSVERAMAAIRGLITSRELLPGERLMPERELADRLGVSRPTVREAVKRLSEGGLLESRPRSGTYVAAIDLDALFDVRLALEPLAARLGASRRTAPQRRELEALLKQMRKAVDDPSTFADLDADLHRVVWAAAANPLLSDVLERLSDLGRLARTATSGDARVRVAALKHLSRLVEAVGSKDERAAAQAMETHLRRVREAVLAGDPADAARSRWESVHH